MSEFVNSEMRDGVLCLTLNRPDKKNALTQDMYSALSVSLNVAEEDLSVGAVLIAGVEGCFTAGNDLKDFQQNPPMDEEAPVVQFLLALARSTVPLVAAVEGPAVGIGSTMLLHCDYAVATEDARFHFPFVNLALPPEAGSTYLLTRQLGHLRAAELLMEGAPFDGNRAREIGLVNDLCGQSDLRARAMRKALSYASKPPVAMRKTKRLMKSDMDRVLDQIRLEMREFAASLRSGECQEALAAFVEKRAPDFSAFRG